MPNFCMQEAAKIVEPNNSQVPVAVQLGFRAKWCSGEGFRCVGEDESSLGLKGYGGAMTTALGEGTGGLSRTSVESLAWRTGHEGCMACWGYNPCVFKS